MSRLVRAVLFAAVFFLGVCGVAAAQPKTITLPQPDKTGGRPLMQVLQDRQSQRELRRDPLPLPMLSNLLWAAWGISRADGRRTAPSASNRQEIDVYVALPDALYVYDAKAHALQPVVPADLRAATGTQGFAGEAALNLVYVADLEKMNTAADNQLPWASANAAFIAENVYLFCASERLATVVRASVDRDSLAKAMRLRPEQRIIFAQSVGYAKAAAPTR